MFDALDDVSDERDLEVVSTHSCNGEDSDDKGIQEIPLRYSNNDKKEHRGIGGTKMEETDENIGYQTFTHRLPAFFDDGYISAHRAPRRSNTRISTMGDLHVILQRERYRGTNLNDIGASRLGGPNEAHITISLGTASARASILTVSKPMLSLLTQKEAPQKDSSKRKSTDNHDKEHHDKKRIYGSEMSDVSHHKHHMDNVGNGQVFRSLKDHSIGSSAKAQIHGSRDHQVEVFDRIVGSEETKKKKTNNNDRFRIKAAQRLRSSRQQAIVSRLSSETSAKQHVTDLGTLYESMTSMTNDADDFLTAGSRETLGDAIVDPGLPNTPTASARASRRASSVVAQARHRRSSIVGNVLLGSSRRNCETMPTMDEIMKMVQDIPISNHKLKWVEIPRLRSRFHDREGKILNNMFEEALSTTRRTNERVAESLGLEPQEWDWQHTYSVSVPGLKTIAEGKLARRQIAAVRLIEACWLARLMRRERNRQNLLRQQAAVRLQRWWRCHFAFIPVRRKAKRRLEEKHAAIKIQAHGRRYLLRNRMQLVIEMHHMIYSLSKMQCELKNMESNKLLRWQAISKALMLRKRLLDDRVERRALVAAFDGQLASQADADLEDGSERDDYIEISAFDGQSMLGRKRNEPACLGSPADDCRLGNAKFPEMFLDDDDSLPSTRAPSSRAYNHSTSRLSSRTPTRTGPPSRDAGMWTPTPPPGKPTQRPHSSCSGRAASVGSPHHPKFHHILPRRRYVEWSPLTKRAMTPVR